MMTSGGHTLPIDGGCANGLRPRSSHKHTTAVSTVMLLTAACATAVAVAASSNGSGGSILVVGAYAHASIDFTKMKLTQLNHDTFETQVLGNRAPSHAQAEAIRARPPWFIMIYSPQCTHCEAMLPLFDAAARATRQGGTNYAAINGMANQKLCDMLGMRRFPLFVYVVNGRVYKYNGPVDNADSFLEAGNAMAEGHRKGTFFEGDVSTMAGIKTAMGLPPNEATDDGEQYCDAPFQIPKPMFVMCSPTRLGGGAAAAAAAAPTGIPSNQPHHILHQQRQQRAHVHQLAEGLVMEEGRPRFYELVEDEGPPMSDRPNPKDYCGGMNSNNGDDSGSSFCYSPLQTYWSIRKVCHETRANARLLLSTSSASIGTASGGDKDGVSSTTRTSSGGILGPNGEVFVVVSDRSVEPTPYLGPAWEGARWADVQSGTPSKGAKGDDGDETAHSSDKSDDASHTPIPSDPTNNLGLRPLLLADANDRTTASPNTAPTATASTYAPSDYFRTHPQLALWVWEHSFNLVEKATFAPLQAASARSLLVVLVTKKDMSLPGDKRYYPLLRMLAKDRYGKFLARQQLEWRNEEGVGLSSPTTMSRSTFGGVLLPTASFGAGAVAAHAAANNFNLSALDDRQSVAKMVASHEVLPPQFLLGTPSLHADWYDYVGVGGTISDADGSNLPLLFVADPIKQFTYEFPLKPLRVKKLGGGGGGSDGEEGGSAEGSRKKSGEGKKSTSSEADDTSTTGKKKKKNGKKSSANKKSPLLSHKELLVQLNDFIDAIEEGRSPVEGVPFSFIGRVAMGITKVVPYSIIILEAMGYEYMPFVMIGGALVFVAVMLCVGGIVAYYQGGDGNADDSLSGSPMTRTKKVKTTAKKDARNSSLGTLEAQPIVTSPSEADGTTTKGASAKAATTCNAATSPNYYALSMHDGSTKAVVQHHSRECQTTPSIAAVGGGTTAKRTAEVGTSAPSPSNSNGATAHGSAINGVTSKTTAPRQHAHSISGGGGGGPSPHALGASWSMEALAPTPTAAGGGVVNGLLTTPNTRTAMGLGGGGAISSPLVRGPSLADVSALSNTNISNNTTAGLVVPTALGGCSSSHSNSATVTNSPHHGRVLSTLPPSLAGGASTAGSNTSTKAAAAHRQSAQKKPTTTTTGSGKSANRPTTKETAVSSPTSSLSGSGGRSSPAHSSALSGVGRTPTITCGATGNGTPRTCPSSQVMTHGNDDVTGIHHHQHHTSLGEAMGLLEEASGNNKKASKGSRREVGGGNGKASPRTRSNHAIDDYASDTSSELCERDFTANLRRRGPKQRGVNKGSASASGSPKGCPQQLHSPPSNSPASTATVPKIISGASPSARRGGERGDAARGTPSSTSYQATGAAGFSNSTSGYFGRGTPTTTSSSTMLPPLSPSRLSLAAAAGGVGAATSRDRHHNHSGRDHPPSRHHHPVGYSDFVASIAAKVEDAVAGGAVEAYTRKQLGGGPSVTPNARPRAERR